MPQALVSHARRLVQDFVGWETSRNCSDESLASVRLENGVMILETLTSFQQSHIAVEWSREMVGLRYLFLYTALPWRSEIPSDAGHSLASKADRPRVHPRSDLCELGLELNSRRLIQAKC